MTDSTLTLATLIVFYNVSRNASPLCWGFSLLYFIEWSWVFFWKVKYLRYWLDHHQFHGWASADSLVLISRSEDKLPLMTCQLPVVQSKRSSRSDSKLSSLLYVNPLFILFHTLGRVNFIQWSGDENQLLFTLCSRSYMSPDRGQTSNVKDL